MTTKQRERDALSKIRDIVDGLGSDSHIAAAFAGCFEIAEQNIERDLMDSMKRTAEAAENQKAKAEAELEEAKKHILHGWLYKGLWVFLTDEAKRYREQMAASADVMADMADTPKDIAFVSAVKSYRENKEQAEICEQMAAGVEEIGLED